MAIIGAWRKERFDPDRSLRLMVDYHAPGYLFLRLLEELVVGGGRTARNDAIYRHSESTHYTTENQGLYAQNDVL